MAVLFCADTHFGHGTSNPLSGIIKHARRPWQTVEDMDAALIKNWNAVVGKGDIVYILGDFAWKNHLHYLMALKGKKILIQGSHDKMKQDVLQHFTEVWPCHMVSVDGQRIWLSHCCFRIWEASHYGCWHFHGHSHGRLQTWNLSMDVGIDVEQRYRPWHFHELKARMLIRMAEMRAAGRVVVENNKELWRQDDVRFWMNKAGIQQTKGELHE